MSRRDIRMCSSTCGPGRHEIPNALTSTTKPGTRYRALSAELNALKLARADAPWLPWRAMASSMLKLRLSCMNRPRARSPQSGAVLTRFRDAAPPFCTMPSPVLRLCSRKSPSG